MHARFLILLGAVFGRCLNFSHYRIDSQRSARYIERKLRDNLRKILSDREKLTYGARPRNELERTA